MLLYLQLYTARCSVLLSTFRQSDLSLLRNRFDLSRGYPVPEQRRPYVHRLLDSERLVEQHNNSSGLPKVL